MAAANTGTPQRKASEMPSARDDAIRRLCAAHLHQVLWLPESSSHERLRVTFSTTSNFGDLTLPVILFCNPMFGSRWVNVEFDRLAVLNGVRIVSVDRPGMGGSTRVPLSIRIDVWLEAVPVLLKQLKVEHVSLMSHSAGTMYCLNTLYHLRDVLDPERPYVAIIAPWVHNKQSEMVLWNVVSKLPIGMIDSWNSIGKFIQTNVAPSISWSGGLISAVSNVFNTKTDTAMTPGQQFDTSEEVGKEIEKLKTKFFFEEDTTAANEEAKLCLKKDGLVSWTACEDYETYVQELCAREKDSREANEGLPKLKVQAYFGESDVMIGKGGQTYFDKCWRQNMVSGVIDYNSVELPDTDHDSALFDQEKGAVKLVFAEVGKAT